MINQKNVRVFLGCLLVLIFEHNVFKNIVLKHQLIPARTAGEEAFWKCAQTDRQTDRTI